MLVQRANTTGYEPSANDIRLRNSVYHPVEYLSMSLCGVALLTITCFYIHPVSRPMLDRNSCMAILAVRLRLLFGISVIVLEIRLPESSHTHNVCNFASSVFIFGSHGSSFLLFCNGLNLQLVTVHGVDGRKMEKYYVGGSLMIAAILGVLNMGTKPWRYSPEIKMCTAVAKSDPAESLMWSVVLIYFWNLSVMAGEIIVFASVLTYMIRLQVFDDGFRRRQARINDSSKLSASRQYSKPRGPKQYRNIVLRISLYPLSCCITAGIASVLHLSVIKTGLQDRTSFLLHFVDRSCLIESILRRKSSLTGSRLAGRTVYVSRGTLYALVASMDPATTRAIKSLYRHYTRKTTVPTRRQGNGSGIVAGNCQEWEHDHVLEPVESSSLAENIVSSGSRHAADGSCNSMTLPPRPGLAFSLPAVAVSYPQYSTFDGKATEKVFEDSELVRGL
ncbi:hypothetical protein PM082_010300 [Marasmius tenuissimus]|nr:hypothetical protein PM082_010300 [Marasmius tenuissimus]